MGQRAERPLLVCRVGYGRADDYAKQHWGVQRLAGIDGTSVFYKDPLMAAGALGWMASLAFDATNGRKNLFGCQLSGVTASVTDGATASTLAANGYSFYGMHANGLGRFTFLRGGMVSGQFKWADSYINQIWMNVSFQSDMLTLLLSAGNIPYNTQGDALISAAGQDTINQAIAFGAIRAGVTLTVVEAQEVNNAAGLPANRQHASDARVVLPAQCLDRACC